MAPIPATTAESVNLQTISPNYVSIGAYMAELKPAIADSLTRDSSWRFANGQVSTVREIFLLYIYNLENLSLAIVGLLSCTIVLAAQRPLMKAKASPPQYLQLLNPPASMPAI